MSEKIEEAMLGMRKYMFKNVYTNPKAKDQETKAQNLLRVLYEHYLRYPEEMPEEFKRLLAEGRFSRERIVCDYLAGMTDQYTIETYEELYVPKAWQLN
jgi:dGTPase